MSWLLFDLHGSVAAMCPSGSTILSGAYRYDGFGQQIASSGSITNPWRYRGLLNLTNDFGVGALLDMGARDYATQLGVFTQEDSIQGGAANPMTMNRFLYALSNPATLIDPDGHLAIVDEGDRVYAVSNDLPTRTQAARRPVETGSDCSKACIDKLNAHGVNTRGGPLAKLHKVGDAWINEDGIIVNEDAFREAALGCFDNIAGLPSEVCEAWDTTRDALRDGSDGVFLPKDAVDLIGESFDAAATTVGKFHLDTTTKQVVIISRFSGQYVLDATTTSATGEIGRFRTVWNVSGKSLTTGTPTIRNPGLVEGLERWGRRAAIVGAGLDFVGNMREEFAHSERSLPEQFVRGLGHTLLTSVPSFFVGTAGAAGGCALGSELGVGGCFAGGLIGGLAAGGQAHDLADRFFMSAFGP